MTETWLMGTYLRVLSILELSNEYQDVDDFQKALRPCALDESSLSTGRVHAHYVVMRFLVKIRKFGAFLSQGGLVSPQTCFVSI